MDMKDKFLWMKNPVASLQLTVAGTDKVFETLESPSKANKRLLEAANKHKETVNVKK